MKEEEEEEEEEGAIYASASEGKYTDECASLLAHLGASATIVIVRDGAKGDGFAVAVDSAKVDPAKISAALPAVLRSVAAAIEESAEPRN